MIIVQLKGGLGNQMFQYANARRIAHNNNTKLKLDQSVFVARNFTTPRKYNLNIYNIVESFATGNEINKIKGPRALRFLDKIKPYYKRSHVIEHHFHFDHNIINLPDNIYIEGYYQSEKYFKGIEDIIRKEFTLKNPLCSDALKIRDKITSVNSVLLSIRRGDYVSDKRTNEHHGTCSPEYYYKAVKIISQKVNNPIFFLFSDDIEWAKKNLNIKFPVFYVSDRINNLKNYEEMMLMSYCKHYIIANSCFSWWGAWLNKDKNKIVIAPNKWFNDPNINTNDLIPETWIRI
jgi:hypothetical protein